MSRIKPFCEEKLILIGCAWLPSVWASLPSGWAYALPGPPMAAPLPSHVKSIDWGLIIYFKLTDFLILTVTR